jgi:uncharacterized SAM-binding protein YcdF (DUF218 family)
MSLQALLTTFLLPPLLLVLLTLAGGMLAWRGWRWAGFVAAVAALSILLLATPYVAGQLRFVVQQQATSAVPREIPAAIIVLGAEQIRGQAGLDLGPLSLERVRAGARLARATGLPLLVTGGPLSPRDPPIAQLMAAALTDEFGLPVRWIEPEAHDTRENAVLAVGLLRAEGISAAFVVTHAWHMPRAIDAFRRAGFTAVPAPVRINIAPNGEASDWVPRADHLFDSWLYLREFLGQIVYRLRDGGSRAGAPRQ